MMQPEPVFASGAGVADRPTRAAAHGNRAESLQIPTMHFGKNARLFGVALVAGLAVLGA